MATTCTASQLAEEIGASLRGDGSVTLTGCAQINLAGPSDLTFLANPRYQDQLRRTDAGAVIISPDDLSAAGDRTVLIVEDPYFAFREAMVHLNGLPPRPQPGISPHAVIDPSAKIGSDCHIAPFVVIDADAEIGDRCVVMPHCWIGRGATIGRDCELYAGVSVYENCVLGDRVRLHAGCSIGQHGFGYASKALPEKPVEHHKIPPAGNAVIEDDVEMGAQCSIDRATLGSTVIGCGTKFSNSVTIGHGCTIGRYNLFVAQVGLAGSVKTGDYVSIGGQVGIAPHLTIGDNVQIAAKAGVMTDLPSNKQYGGQPARELSEAKRQFLSVARIPDLTAQVRRLRRRVEKMDSLREAIGEQLEGD